MAYIKIDETNRIIAASCNYHCGEDEIKVTIPEDIDFAKIHDYKYKKGKFTYDPQPEPEETETEESTDLEGRVAELEEALDLLLQGVTE